MIISASSVVVYGRADTHLAHLELPDDTVIIGTVMSCTVARRWGQVATTREFAAAPAAPAPTLRPLQRVVTHARANDGMIACAARPSGLRTVASRRNASVLFAILVQLVTRQSEHTALRCVVYTTACRTLCGCLARARCTECCGSSGFEPSWPRPTLTDMRSSQRQLVQAHAPCCARRGGRTCGEGRQ